eukprot:5059143-Heterocapsa_arctica.AAC.2
MSSLSPPSPCRRHAVYLASSSEWQSAPPAVLCPSEHPAVADPTVVAAWPGTASLPPCRPAVVEPQDVVPAPPGPHVPRCPRDAAPLRNQENRVQEDGRIVHRERSPPRSPLDVRSRLSDAPTTSLGPTVAPSW